MDGVKVQDYPGLIRPKNSGGVVNTDRDAYERALLRRKKAKKDSQLEQRVTAMEGKLDTILTLLSALTK